MAKSTVLVRSLDTNGDGTGVHKATGDYSATPTKFFIQPPTSEIYEIRRLVISLEDTGSLDSGRYGNNVLLTNGFSIVYEDDSGVISDLTNGIPIHSNADWGHFCYDVNNLDFGSGNDHLVVRYSFWKFSDSGVTLKGRDNERLSIVLNDNFTGLEDHTFVAQGQSTEDVIA